MYTWLRSLVVPDAPEPLPLSHLRRGVVIMLISAPTVLLLNALYTWAHRAEILAAGQLGVIGAVVNLGCHLAGSSLAVFLWFRGHHERRLIRGITASLVLLGVASWF